METFPLLKFRLCRLGILQLDKSPRAKTNAIRTNCIVIGICITFSLTSGCYLAFTAKTKIEITTGSVYTFISLLIGFWYSLLVWNKEKIEKLFIDLDAIIEKRIESDDQVKKIYYDTNNKITTLTKLLYVLHIQILVPIFIVAPIIISIIKFVSSDCSNDSLLQIFPATFPFNWKTPTGYLGCIFIQAIIAIVLSEVTCTVTVLIFGLCFFTTSFVSDLEEKLRQSDDVINASKNGSFSPRQLVKLKKILADFISFHGEAREFTVRISDILGDLISVYFMFVVAVFGSISLTINTSIRSGDISGILQISIVTFLCLLNSYLFCLIGDYVTSRFESLGDKVYQLNWYMLPLDMQKDLVTVIAMSQKRVFVRGYADIRSTREVFTKILKNKFFFLLMIRKLGVGHQN